MKTIKSITITLFAIVAVLWGVLVSGCSNPYINPNTSKAVTEQAQLEEMKAQSIQMQEQTRQLKRIADVLSSDTIYPKFQQPHK